MVFKFRSLLKIAPKSPYKNTKKPIRARVGKMEYVLYLDWANRSKNELIGSRGALLNSVLEKDIKTQGISYITKDSFESFLVESGLKERLYSLIEGTDHTSTDDLNNTYGKVKAMFKDTDLPWDMEMELSGMIKKLTKQAGLKQPHLIFHPSYGLHSSVPDYDRKMNEIFDHPKQDPVISEGKPNSVLASIKNIWADMFSPDAIRFRRMNSIGDRDIYVAISAVSCTDSKNTGYTLIPGSQSVSDIKIGSIFGLLPGLYEDELKPDEYKVNNRSLEIINKDIKTQPWRYGISEEGEVIKYRVGENRQNKQKISDEQIKLLARIANRVSWEDKLDLKMEWIMVDDEALITGVSKQESTDSVSTVFTEPAPDASSPKKEKVAEFDLGFFGGFFGGEDDTDDLSLPETPTMDEPTPALVKQVVEKAPVTQVVNIDLDNVNLNEDRLGTKMYLDILSPGDLEKAQGGRWDGVFVTGEQFFIKSFYGAHPNVLREKGEEKASYDDIRYRLTNIAKATAPKPAIVRTSDFGAQEYLDLSGASQFEIMEPNFLNWRGVSRYLHPFFKQAFKNELNCIKAVRDQGHANLSLMLPYVRTPQEMSSVLDMVKEVGFDSTFKVWVQASFPSALALAEKYSDQVAGIVVDHYLLSLITLGIDPGLEKPESIMHVLKDQYDIGLYEYILQLVDEVPEDIEVVFLDTRGAKDSRVLDMLVEYGIDGLIMGPSDHKEIRNAVAGSERRYLTKAIREIQNR